MSGDDFNHPHPDARADAPMAVPIAQPVTLLSDQPAMLGYAGYGIGIWREGKTVGMQKGAALPTDRCFKCNATSDGKPLKRTLYWHHPAIYIVILLALLIYVLVAMIVRKKAVVHIGLCPKHRSRRRWMIAMGILLLLGAFPVMVVGGQMDIGLIVIGGLLSLLAGLVLLMLASQIVTPKRIDDEHVWIRGAGSAFLATLPGRPN